MIGSERLMVKFCEYDMLMRRDTLSWFSPNRNVDADIWLLSINPTYNGVLYKLGTRQENISQPMSN